MTKKNKSSANVANLSARLCAVQAHYQTNFNKRPLKKITREYLDDYVGMHDDEEDLIKPDIGHFKTVLHGAEDRKLEIEPIIQANIGAAGQEKQLEPLLNSIFMCGVYELLSLQDIDSPIIINDYIEVTKAFYGDNEAKFVNGALDAIAGLVRA